MIKATLLVLALAAPNVFAAKFQDFPVTPDAPAPIPPLHGARYKMFRSTAMDLLRQYRSGEVRALGGRFVFTQIGCGTECMVLAGIDLKTGEFKLFSDIQAFAMKLRPNSRLLIINPGGEKLIEYYPEQQFIVDDDFKLRQVK